MSTQSINTVSSYWWTEHKNFGDLITPLLLKHYGLEPKLTPVSKAKVIAVGSLLDGMPENYAGFIVGAGLISDTERHFKQAKILALRGELTRQRVSAEKTVVLGDPGLLTATLFNKRCSKRFTLGLIPHFVDKHHPYVQSFYKRYYKDITIIDVQQNPMTVIQQIDQCDSILSSSLHGIVVADALGIPNAWMKLSDNVVGNGFKFFDYASAIDRKLHPFVIHRKDKLVDLLRATRKVQGRVDEVKCQLDTVFKTLNKEIFALEINHA